MANQIVKKEEAKKSEIKVNRSKVSIGKKGFTTTEAYVSGYTTFERKADEMKVFLSLNPIPDGFLKKK